MDKVDHDVDHVHVMFRAQPKSELSKFINAYKRGKQSFVKKGISTDQGKTLEGSILESKFLSVDSGWCTD